jgi:hypothetical protein
MIRGRRLEKYVAKQGPDRSWGKEGTATIERHSIATLLQPGLEGSMLTHETTWWSKGFLLLALNMYDTTALLIHVPETF